MNIGQKLGVFLPSVQSMINVQKEQVAPIAQGLSTATFGIPKALLSATHPELAKQGFSEQSTLAGKGARFGAEALGYGLGGSAKLATNVARKAIGPVAKGVAAGTVGGGTQILQQPKDLKDLADKQSSQALGGAAVGLAGGIVGKSYNWLNKSNDRSADFMRKVRAGVFKTKKMAVDEFGENINELSKLNPDKNVRSGN